MIYHGDCREILPMLEFDLVLTDPPYGIGWSRGVNQARNSKSHDGIVGDDDTSARDEALMLITGPAIVFGSFYVPFPANTRQILVWNKPSDAGVVGSTTGYRRDVEPIFLVGLWPIRSVQWSSAIRSSRGISAVVSETGHPHTKPVELLEQLLRNAPYGKVCDPFCGSGSSLVAAKNLGREAIGIEIEEKYCEIAAKRLSQEVLQFG